MNNHINHLYSITTVIIINVIIINIIIGTIIFIFLLCTELYRTELYYIGWEGSSGSAWTGTA